jgi:hypothetical protein
MILETDVEVLPSIEGAIDARFTGKRAFHGTCYLISLYHPLKPLEKGLMLRKCCWDCQYK